EIRRKAQAFNLKKKIMQENPTPSFGTSDNTQPLRSNVFHKELVVSIQNQFAQWRQQTDNFQTSLIAMVDSLFASLDSDDESSSTAGLPCLDESQLAEANRCGVINFDANSTYTNEVIEAEIDKEMSIEKKNQDKDEDMEMISLLSDDENTTKEELPQITTSQQKHRQDNGMQFDMN
ncbi:hypothetical protein RFI_19641, partial [Reticulomyxa filosa]